MPIMLELGCAQRAFERLGRPDGGAIRVPLATGLARNPQGKITGMYTA